MMRLTCGRSPSLSRRKTKPLETFRTVEFACSTAGCEVAISATLRCARTIASQLVPSAGSVLTTSRPVSSLGRKPFGTARQSGIMRTSTTPEKARTERG